MVSRTIKGVFDPEKCCTYIEDKRLVDSLEERWFGEKSGDKIILSLIETSYLLLKNALIVNDGEEDINELSKLMYKHYNCFKTMFWPQLAVYNDLRSRGRKTKVLGENLFIVKHKDGSFRLINVLEEKRLVKVNDFLNNIIQARKNGLIYVAAIVSLQGDLTYYVVSEIDLRKR